MFQEGSRGPANISYVLEQDYVRVPSRGECEDPECLAGGCLVQVYLDNYQAMVGGEAVVVGVLVALVVAVVVAVVDTVVVAVEPRHSPNVPSM